jgi:hypothetical protein
MAIFINLVILNKMDNRIFQITYQPFHILIYYYFNFFKELIKRYSNKLDIGINPFFPGEHYNYFKTKDDRFISIGNLEEKFQANFNKDLDKLNGISNEPYTMSKVKKIIGNRNRDELTTYV